MYMTCDKPDTGSALSRETCGSPAYPVELGISPASPSWELKDTGIGNYSCPSTPRKLWRRSNSPSEFKGCMLKPPVPLQPRIIAEKKTQEMESRLNLERNHSVGIMALTGIELKRWRKQVDLMKSQVIFSFGITEPLLILQQIMSRLQAMKSLSSFITVRLEPAKAVEHGAKRAYLHTLRIQGPNFGVATAVMSTLLSMNLEVVLMSRTCSGGWIDILSELRLKEAPVL